MRIDFVFEIRDITGQPEEETMGFSTGQTWGALRKAWKAYKIAKVQNDTNRMREYATRIRKLQTELGVPQASFPALGIS